MRPARGGSCSARWCCSAPGTSEDTAPSSHEVTCASPPAAGGGITTCSTGMPCRGGACSSVLCPSGTLKPNRPLISCGSCAPPEAR
eukprot:scaffold13821_cov30-Tisochrysis_lutea.AAC.3